MNTVITSKEAILNASRKIATKQGLQAINIRDVAKECNVAVGSIYNYFPSKADLLAATVEEVWKSIFHMPENLKNSNSFMECVRWIFESVQSGTEEYPAFFTIHSISFATGDKETGRQVMNQYFEHIKSGLLLALQKDKKIRTNAFHGEFTQENFVDFVFSNIISLLMKNEKTCTMLIEVINRLVY